MVQSPDAILKLACLADILDYPDYALELMAHLTIAFGEEPQYNLSIEILEVLSQFPELVNQGLDNLPIIQQIKQHIDLTRP